MARIATTFCVGFSVLVLGAVPLRAADPAYRIRVVAMTGQTMGNATLTSLGDPAVDAVGNIVFSSVFQIGARGFIGLFTPERMLFRIGDVVAGNGIANVLQYARNVHGTVEFLAQTNGGKQIVSTLTQRIASNGTVIDGLTIQTIESFALNDRDQTVFHASFPNPDGTIGEGLFSPDHVLLKTGDVVGGVTLFNFGTHRLSATGKLVFVASDTNGMTGIFTQDSVVTRDGDTIGGQQFDSLVGPAVSLLGHVAFNGRFGDDGSGIFTETKVLAKTGDQISGHVLRDVGAVSINDFGTVAFLAGFDSGVSSGVFTPRSLVIGNGDQVDGHPILSFGPPVIDERGTITVTATLDVGNAILQAIPLGGPVLTIQ